MIDKDNLCWWCEEVEGTVVGKVVDIPGHALNGQKERLCQECFYFVRDEEKVQKAFHICKKDIN